MTRSKKPNEMRVTSQWRNEKKTSQWFSFEIILVIAHCAYCNFYVWFIRFHSFIWTHSIKVCVAVCVCCLYTFIGRLCLCAKECDKSSAFDRVHWVEYYLVKTAQRTQDAKRKQKRRKTKHRKLDEKPVYSWCLEWIKLKWRIKSVLCSTPNTERRPHEMLHTKLSSFNVIECAPSK